MDEISNIIKYHKSYGDLHEKKNPVKRSVRHEDVDRLADELSNEYANPHSRGWYCGVIYKFGVSKVLEWQKRASTGNQPGRLFTSYVNQAGGYRRGDK